MASSNPAMNDAIFQRAGHADTPANVMTLQGTVLKTSVLVAIMAVTAAFTWAQARAGDVSLAYGLLAAGGIGGAIMAFITIFFPKASPFTSPIYAALEGLF